LTDCGLADIVEEEVRFEISVSDAGSARFRHFQRDSVLLQRFTIWLLAVGSLLLGTGVASGQGYPSKPVRIVTSEAAGGADFVARLTAPALSANLGQPVIIENRPGGVIPGSIVSKATPDGYTLLVYGGAFYLGPIFQSNVPYDVFKDFAPITLLTSAPSVLVVHPQLPAHSVKELIALARARPGTLNFASISPSSATTIAAVLFKSMAAIDIVDIPYKATSQGLTDLLGGQVHMMFPPAGAITPLVKAGKVKALAVTTARPSALFPDLPTMAASGLTGYETGSTFGMFVPTRTPAAIISRINQETVKAINRTDVKEKFLASANEIVTASPEETARKIKTEYARVEKVMKETGFQRQ
jgi:tripartite-type tricarboxylate transporter receptor subunit TctC